jgi:hypothetical protein
MAVLVIGRLQAGAAAPTCSMNGTPASLRRRQTGSRSRMSRRALAGGRGGHPDRARSRP